MTWPFHLPHVLLDGKDALHRVPDLFPGKCGAGGTRPYPNPSQLAPRANSHPDQTTKPAALSIFRQRSMDNHPSTN